MTHDPTTRPDIGIVGLPDVAAALRSAGLVVVGGGPFGDVAKTIRQHLDGGVFPILSTTEAAPWLRTWLSAQAGKGVEVGLVPVAGSELAVAGASVLDLPCAVDDLVCALGLDPIGGPVGSAEVAFDGTVTGAGVPAAPVAPSPAPAVADAGPWDDSPAAPEPASVAEPAPVADTPDAPDADAGEVDDFPVPAPVVAADDDDDDDLAAAPEPVVPVADFEPAPEPALEAAPEPEPDLDPLAAPLPAPPDLSTDPWASTPEPPPVTEPALPPPPVAAPVDPPPPAPAPPAVAPPPPAPAPAPLPPPPVVEAPPAPAPPPPAPPVPAPVAPAVDGPGQDAPAGDIEDVFDHAVTAPPSIEPSRHRAAADCPVIFVIAGKGGVGKTTFTAQLGQRAGEAGLRAVVVDANRGQADITTYLRLGRAGLPTIADAAGSGRYEQAILPADRLNGSRHQRLEPVSFSAILGPPPEKSDPRLVTADVYRQMISLARRDADVIVVDTQIAEATDTSGLIDGLVVPMLAEGAWALAVTDLSTASVKNLHGILGRWRERTVPRDRVLLAVNRADPSTTVDQGELGQAFANVADFVGLVHSNPEMTASLNRGAVRPSAPELLTVLDTVLHRVTGFDEFDPSLHAVAQTSLMDRLRRRRGR